MRVHLTRAATFSPFCRFLEAGEIDVSRRLTSIGISPDLLEDPEQLVPLRPCCRFVNHVKGHEGIEDLGIVVGSQNSLVDFGLFGLVMRQSLTLKDLIEKFIQWLPLVDSGVRAWMEPAGTPDAVRICLNHDIDLARALINEYALIVLIDGIRMAAGPEWRPTTVWMDRQDPGSLQRRFEALSEATIHRESDWAGILLPTHLLGLPIRRDRQERNAGGEVTNQLASTAPPEDLVGSIIFAIRHGLVDHALSLDEIADLTGTSGRTIQRTLFSLGTSYRELLDRVRFEEATTLLRDSRHHITEIAYHLGYTEPANFTHAFRRWTGHSPATYRRQALQVAS
ncbi:MAG: AraC family transcriptional regulator ligand-binding domain-containing protein [Verrucomicrobiae bacterium]|nr:AraC family transcriptional regulator ligand-binding domain-containing protein [Verrucomicrobiae bacterium]